MGGDTYGEFYLQHSNAIRFIRCFLFISGGNSKNMQIEMTAPVLIIPVQSKSGYKVAFFVPSRFKSVNDLPIPMDPNVKFSEHNETVVAVIGPFDGFPDDYEYETKSEELRKYLDRDGIKYDESFVAFAGYSSPFEFRNRKQEVHLFNILS